jgi:hypothetical protein
VSKGTEAMLVSRRHILILLFVLACNIKTNSLADEEVDGSETLARALKESRLPHDEDDHFFVVTVKMPTGFVQNVFVKKEAHVLGDVPFIEITAIGWQWEEATEFNRQNANWLLDASAKTKVGGWQSLVFEDKEAIAAEFKATIPLDSNASTFKAVIKAVASSAFELHDIMDR